MERLRTPCGGTPARASWLNGAMRKVIAVLLASLAIVSPAEAAKKRKTVVDGVVASVDGRPILLSQLRKRAQAADLRETLETMIYERLVVLDADRLGIIVTGEDIDAEIKRRGRVANEAEYFATGETLRRERWLDLAVKPQQRPGEDLGAATKRRIAYLRSQADMKEGPRYRVGKMATAFADPALDAEMRRQIRVRAGDLFDRRRLEEDSKRMKAVLRARGKPDGVSVDLEGDAKKKVVDMTFRPAEK